MPAVKIRVPNADAPKYGVGNLSQLAKQKLLEAIGGTTEWPAPVEPSSALPASIISVWLSGAEHAALAARVEGSDIPGVEPLATALLHGWALSQATNAAELKPSPVVVAQKTDPSGADDEGPRHSLREISASVAKADNTPAAVKPGDLPWEEEQPPAVRIAADSPGSTLDRLNAAFGNDTRPDQMKFYSQIVGEFAHRQAPAPVFAAEAATGLGKTRVFIAAMLDWSRQHPEDTACLTAPSYTVLFQAVELWAVLREKLPDVVPDAVTLLGQQEFVSPLAIERFLATTDRSPEGELVEAWVKAGGPPPKDDVLNHPWLMRGLIEACGGRWTYAKQCALDQSAPDDDPGRLSYNEQFRDAKQVPWVFCTHAMLATDVRRRLITARQDYKKESGGKSVSQVQWEAKQKAAEEERRGKFFWQEQNDMLRSLVDADGGRLPDIGLLVVDEAHLIEENFARIFATGASIASMMRSLGQLREAYPKHFAAGDMKTMAECWETLKRIGEAQSGDSIVVKEVAGAAQAVTQVSVLLNSIANRKVKLDQKHAHLMAALKQTSRALNIAAASNGDKSGMMVRVSWSPSAHYPSIEVGRYDISRELDFLWTCLVSERAILVSATLCDDVAKHGADGIRQMLAIRDECFRILPPIRPVWTTEPVTLYQPAATSVTEANRLDTPFYRPTPKYAPSREALDAWRERWSRQVADYVTGAYQQAAGGMLVLLTAHSDREAIGALLGASVPKDCLVMHREGLALDAVKSQFLQVLAEGKRPILMAVGSAWTGLDISSASLAKRLGRSLHASEKHALTDLVIANAPVKTNRTLTHQWRCQWSKGFADIIATVILLRQGIGRLVREDDLPRRSRKLHFLDARINDPHWNGYFAPIRKVLAAYTSRRQIEVSPRELSEA